MYVIYIYIIYVLGLLKYLLFLIKIIMSRNTILIIIKIKFYFNNKKEFTFKIIVNIL